MYTFYSGYKNNKFPYALTGVTLSYEILFNISYMASRELGPHNPSKLGPPFEVGLAIFHGTFSLLMFLLLLILMFFAWKNYKKGINFFHEHKNLTVTFIICWLVAVFSGYLFYYQAYLRP
jgi:hypothetical protein